MEIKIFITIYMPQVYALRMQETLVSQMLVQDLHIVEICLAQISQLRFRLVKFYAS